MTLMVSSPVSPTAFLNIAGIPTFFFFFFFFFFGQESKFDPTFWSMVSRRSFLATFG